MHEIVDHVTSIMKLQCDGCGKTAEMRHKVVIRSPGSPTERKVLSEEGDLKSPKGWTWKIFESAAWGKGVRIDACSSKCMGLATCKLMESGLARDLPDGALILWHEKP